ncbi:MAG: RluA family pseudouridine synthase [Deltaproteobacteria bacterium]|nr:RluA family pseudouridine synthase [Deltaproteobacteria bacterium]
MAIAELAALSRATVQRLIEEGRVTLGGRVVTKAGQRVRTGAAIEVRIPAPIVIELVAEDIPLVVMYEDSELIVIDKPAGLVVHPAPGHPRGTLVNALLHHCKDLGGIGGELRPGIVHRLDKDTSGSIVAAKTERAHAGLSAQFAAKSRGDTDPNGILREYLGIAVPPPLKERGTLRTFHGRHPTDRKKFSTRVMWGKSAVTHFERVELIADGEAALMRFRLETGRTHQIRVHAADHGWPLLGDQLYGKLPRNTTLPIGSIAATLGRQALHAAVLDFEHPVTGERIHCASPLPADFQAALDGLRSLTRSST